MNERFARSAFTKSVAAGESLARELSALLTPRLHRDPRGELPLIVAELQALGHPLRVEQSDDDLQTWVDTHNALALFLHGAFDPAGVPTRVDLVEVLWQRT